MARNGILLGVLFVTSALTPQPSVPATTMVYTPTAGCVAMSYKLFSPNQASPTIYAKVFKVLAAMQVCNTTAMNSAFCNPGVAASTGTLAASAFGAQVTMAPSCAWNCAGSCGSISTTSTGDGLPVELLDMTVDE